MGFAIPSNDVVEIINQLEKDGKVTRPALGISMADLNSLSSSATSKLDLPDEVKSGVVVGSVQKVCQLTVNFKKMMLLLKLTVRKSAQKLIFKPIFTCLLYTSTFLVKNGIICEKQVD